MLHLLSSLSRIIEPGISLDRNEVIKRYRALANCKKQILQLLCMTQFIMLVKNDKGELFLV
jgi:hypothetical protein